MSEEILEQHSEEEMDQELVEAMNSSDEEVVEESRVPSTKAGMMKAIYDSLNGMKKAELSDSYTNIMRAMSLYEMDNSEDDDEEEDEDKEMKEVKKVTKESIKIDVEEDVRALMGGEELTEDFKSKAATIFEAAVTAKVIEEVNQRVEILEENYSIELSEAKAEMRNNLVEKVDSYLNYIVEEWMKENELAVERGIRSELVEDFMSGLKNLFQEHYIDIPEEKVDLVDDLFEKVEDLETKLDEAINYNVNVKKELDEYKREEVIRAVAEDLTEMEREKLNKLAEGLDYSDDHQFFSKLEVLKENYFPNTTSEMVSLTEEYETAEEDDDEVERVDPSMAVYVNALKRKNI